MPPAGPREPESVLRLRGEPLKSSQDVAAYFGIPHHSMIWTLYRAPDSSRYRHFEIPKRSGGMRPIHAPIGLLRELQDKLHQDLKALYRPHPRAHGFIDMRSVATNAADHTGKRWVLNVDLEDFFPSINFGRIRGLFLKPPFEMGAAAAAVCAQIATYRNGLPQGAPTSPALSNFIAAALDRRLLRLARQNKLVYSRYADDITLSTMAAQFPPAVAIREALEGGVLKVRAGKALEETIAASGFAINAKKVRIQGHGVQQSVTGLPVNTRVNVERRRIRKIRAMLHAWRKFGLEAAGADHFDKHRTGGPRARPDRAGAAFRNIVYGHLSFVKMVRGREDPLFLKLCAKVLEVDPNPSKFIRQMVFGADDYEIFISHASVDKAEIARPVFEACGRAGLKAFLDETHIGWGDSFTDKINTALGAARTVLAVISANSVTKEWPLLEVNTALALEASGAKRVVPLMVGRPDLSKLPLIRAKKWLVWEGNADTVALELKRLVKGPDQPLAIEASGGAPPAKTEPKRPPVIEPSQLPDKVGWLSRLWSRDRSS
jgi:RNA-directed DNA polymerase